MFWIFFSLWCNFLCRWWTKLTYKSQWRVPSLYATPARVQVLVQCNKIYINCLLLYLLSGQNYINFMFLLVHMVKWIDSTDFIFFFFCKSIILWIVSYFSSILCSSSTSLYSGQSLSCTSLPYSASPWRDR